MAAREAESGWRPLPANTDLEDLFARVDTRIVSPDNTVRLHGTVIQLLPGPSHARLVGARVQIHRRLDGQFTVYLKDRRLPTQIFPTDSFSSLRTFSLNT